MTGSALPLRSAIVLAALAGALEAAVPPSSPASAKAFRHPDLTIQSLEHRAGDLPAVEAGRVLELVALGASADTALFDWRAGGWSSLVTSVPLLPGDGVGNALAPPRAVGEAEARQAFLGYLRQHRPALRIDPAELATPRVTIHEQGRAVLIHAARIAGGLPVRDSGVTAVITHGNLVLLGIQQWGAIDASLAPQIAADAARAAAVAHALPFRVSGFRDAERLELVPMARGQHLKGVVQGNGYAYRLAWVLSPTIDGDSGRWEALVDAGSGELLAFQDTTQYAVRRVLGGVYPVSNDQRPPDGIEQVAWPIPYANVVGTVTSFTTTGGMLQVCEQGPIQTTLQGQYVRVFDLCGPVSESSAAGDIDLGFGPMAAATDCVVPPGHSGGDTKASRSSYYAMNRIREQAIGYLPGNAWLQSANILSNVNGNGSCGASWGGTGATFFRENTMCRNTGEIAGIVVHEWGHGLDQNGTNPNISSPSEAIADVHSVLQMNASCVARGFFKNLVCSGYGDPCVGTPATGCTGVRDADFAQHVSGQPHGITWVRANCAPSANQGPCGRIVHCESQIVDEAAWDLHFRDLRGAPFNYDAATALELTTRLMYLAPDALTSWYTCAAGCETTGTCGCGATGGYFLTLALDDDDGNIANGTPHMTAIRAAFERHQIHCASLPVSNSGCAGGPPPAPPVTAAPTAGGVLVSWGAVPTAVDYAVYRTEGVNGCAFGRTLVGHTAGTSFADLGLLDGRTYHYSVMAAGPTASCFSAMSSCVPAVAAIGVDPCFPVELLGFSVD